MKLIILTSIVALFWLPFSHGYACNCACCTNLPSCTPVSRPAVDVADCSSCSSQLCTSQYPSQCPTFNSIIKSACSSVSTSGSSGTATTNSTGISITGNGNIKYLLFVAFASVGFLTTQD
jgi:hypothetical protein